MSEEINISINHFFYFFLFILINKHLENIKQQIKTYILFKSVIEIGYRYNQLFNNFKLLKNI